MREDVEALRVRPVRLQLSRKAGFDLQALSIATNGLPAVKVARPGRFGNPFSVQDAADVHDSRQESAHHYAVRWFRDWITTPLTAEAHKPMHAWDGYQQQHARITSGLSELRGKNLACFCRHGLACHADVLLELANAEDRALIARAEAAGTDGGERG